MSVWDFSPLVHELALWRNQGLTLPVWWRDDDAIAPTKALAKLARLSGRMGLPIHLAIIPEGCTYDLGRYLKDTDGLIPVQHGWAHRSHAPEGEKKAEYGPHRPLEDMRTEIETGWARLQDKLDRPVQPMFVPPWNRIAPALHPHLAQAGIRALSTFCPRGAPEAAPGLQQINTHLDPIDWKGSRDLAEADRLISDIVSQLQDRRMGRSDNAEPYGLLTHHLVHTPAIWDWTEALLDILMSGPVRVWSLHR